jgi:hypothetical protein
MRVWILGLASICSLLACGGSDSQDVLSSSTTAGTSSGTSGTSGTSGSSGTSGTPGTSGTSGNPAPPNECTPEQEPNNLPEQANELAPTRCGTLSGADKVEYLTFRLKSSTKSLQLTFSGRVKLRVSVRGAETIELTPDKPVAVPFVRGEQYLIEVTRLADGASDEPWRVTVIEKT